MHQKRVTRTYLKELGGALALYALLLLAAIRFGRPMEEGAARTLVLLAPMLGFGLALWAIVRHVARLDEYLRRFLLESVAIGAAITAGLSFTYGFLETAGYPRLSMFVVWIMLAGATGAVCLVRRLLDR